MHEKQNQQEIERKFLPKMGELPFELNEGEGVLCERYCLYANEGEELRVQRKGGVCELECKFEEGALVRSGLKVEISERMFEELSKKTVGSRVVYEKFKTPFAGVFVKRYRENFEGLVLVEVEFERLEDEKGFVAEAWMGADVSEMEFCRDAGLAKFGSFEELREAFADLFC
ncbi:hypothetical protein CVV38_04000 [Candidatus Peregrinibacteria bacterium HGW-Peregrinibacteria-1]|jgi:CYTH domain-containing protein|nr:MAG: hypothetical protein CVV38_04000 [Candidatus Peregrinibacteria bacterium HGW-Peregrinibacteria-1]